MFFVFQWCLLGDVYESIDLVVVFLLFGNTG
jgi:hypothetical protein